MFAASSIQRFPGGLVALLVEMRGGARLAGHRHDTPTVVFIANGEILDIGPATQRVLRVGAIRAVAAYETRDVVAGPVGAKVLVVAALPGQPVATHPRVRNGGPLGSSRELVKRLVSLVRTNTPSEQFERLLMDWIVALDSTADKRPAWIERVKTSLDATAPFFPSTRSLAVTAGVRSESLARAFRRNYGISVREYARRGRVVRARDLLAEPGRTLSQVALAAGFADQSHLTREFSLCFGLSPRRYRAALERSEVPRVQDTVFPGVHFHGNRNEDAE
jgi:AraC-like DNA-binding protein